MKRLFKKVMMTIAGAIMMCMPTTAGAKAIMVSDFPAAALQILKKNFTDLNLPQPHFLQIFFPCIK